MAEIESAWGRYPDYRIDIVPCTATAQAWLGELLLAESESCLRPPRRPSTSTVSTSPNA